MWKVLGHLLEVSGEVFGVISEALGVGWRSLGAVGSLGLRGLVL